MVEVPARLEAVERVEVRARIQGTLESRTFEPRSLVRRDQVLFRIEPSRFKARVAQANAQLQITQARASEAAATLERFERALERNAISELEVLQQQAARDTTRAEVDAAKAALRNAELDLQYTLVRSPIEGRISREFINVGNLVGSGEQTLLATVVRTDRMHAYFQVDEQTLLLFRRRQLDRVKDPGGVIPVPVELRLLDEDVFSHKGEIDYVSPELDSASGTIEIRAVFDNSDEFLIPGLFGRIRIIPEGVRDGLVVPIRAINRDVGGSFVLVVNQDEVVETRPVTLGITQGTEREVISGLQGDERIIVDGVNVVRPGDRVAPREATAERANGKSST